MPLVPTAEQVAIVTAAKETQDNLIIRALAGASKTTTLVMIAEALESTTMLCLAFNKAIAETMTQRLPRNCTALTINSIGHRTWAETVGRRLTLNKDKNYNILSRLIKALSKREQEIAFDEFADTLTILGFAKSCGYIPDGQFKQAARLMNTQQFFDHIDEVPSAISEALIIKTLEESIAMSLAGTIDFDDQVFMPTLFPSIFPSYPVTLIDEAQDLSAINHRMLEKIVRKKRLIAVGDENQAIYGFRGAHHDSMDLLQEHFNMRPLHLSISFRCPRAVVREAQWKAPHMKWPEWAEEGLVSTLSVWGAETFNDTTSVAIICRNNAPLFTVAVKLLKNGKYPRLVGNDIGKYLVKVMKKLGKSDMSRERADVALLSWADEKKAKVKNKARVDDQVACIRIFLSQGETLGDAIAYADHLFLTEGPIHLMTGHKAKGLEYDHVYILDKDLIGLHSEDKKSQERNLLYVCQTRAKKTLTYINTVDFYDMTE